MNVLYEKRVFFFTSFRSVRNLVIDLRGVEPSHGATGLHWQVSQATSLTNVWIRMSSEAGSEHRGK